MENQELQSPHERNRPESQSLERSRAAALVPPSFPQEMVADILSNLPVKSLLRFRCVSKSWEALVSDPFFVKKHLKNPKDSKKRVFIKTGTDEFDNCSFKSCSVTAMFEDPIIHLKKIENPSNVCAAGVEITGSCNGLICIPTEEENVFLINPTLRAFKLLPDLVFKRKEGYDPVFGFGFDAYTDDYKVVSVFPYKRKGFEDSSQTTVWVYSLKTNNWRRIQGFPFGVPFTAPFRESAKFVDGCLNWFVIGKRDASSLRTILSLDLAHETYKEVVQPCYGDGAGCKMIGVLDGCLCVVCDHDIKAEVWVMKEYGKNDSWSKLVAIPYTQLPGYGLSSWLKFAITFVLVNGEILLDSDSGLIIYDSKEKVGRKPVFDNADVYCMEHVVYEESLVSPTAVNQLG